MIFTNEFHYNQWYSSELNTATYDRFAGPFLMADRITSTIYAALIMD